MRAEQIAARVWPDRELAIEPLGGGVHAVSLIDQNGFPSEHTPDNPSGVLDTPPPPTPPGGATPPACPKIRLDARYVVTAIGVAAFVTVTRLDAEELKQQGVGIRVVDLYSLQPIDALRSEIRKGMTL